MELWTPPGADLGEFTPPSPDPLMVQLAGGIGRHGQALPMTYRRLEEAAESFVVTSTTPEGAANLLETARSMFALAFYQYKMVTGAVSFSIFAVEVALKARLDRDGSFHSLIEQGIESGMISAETAGVVHAGRTIRNRFIHEGRPTQWSFGMAFDSLGASHKLVAELFPVPQD